MKDYYRLARSTLTIFAVITVILLIITIGIAIKCMLNFDKGLKVHVNRRKLSDSDQKATEVEMGHTGPGTTQPARMEID